MLRLFWMYFWVVWLAMLCIGDPIAVFMGNHDKVGDVYTDTHFIASHIGLGVRVGIYAWLGYHFFIAHKHG